MIFMDFVLPVPTVLCIYVGGQHHTTIYPPPAAIRKTMVVAIRMLFSKI